MADDSLLDELNGAAVVTLIDPLIPESKIDLLEVQPHERPTKTAALDAKHATRTGGKGYSVTVRGDFYAPSKESQGKRMKRPYQVVVNLPTLDAAMSVLKNKLIDNAVLRAHPDSIGVRTLEIVSAIPLSPATTESNNLQFMSQARLEAYIAENAVPIDIKEYADVAVLRSAVIDFTLNPKDFEKREAIRQADRKETAELAALNPEIKVPTA